MAHAGFEVAENIAELKREMLRLANEASKGLLMRSRIEHMENNEKCSRYFFKKLARPRNIIDSLKDSEGNEQTDIENILTTVCTFYSDLYRREDMDREALDVLLAKVNVNVGEGKENLDRVLSVQELTKAMNSMQNNKAPGADGLPKEFYTTFWAEVKDPLLEVFNESLHFGKLPSSMREGTISLLFKKGCKKDIKNWRPLTLLGVDRKILAKALFFRLQEVAGDVVGDDQTCVIPGRTMSDSLALVRDSYLYANDRKIPLCMSALDLEKAFDRISHEYLKEVLLKFGFGPKIRAWIDLLYTDCVSKVMVNGQATDTFEVQSGVRQGCPLSVVLFILVMEPLACAIRQDPSINSLHVPGSGGKEAKLSLYMDDLSVLCTNNRSVVKILQWCDQFSLASGAKLNRAKSEILYLNWKEPTFDFGLNEKTERIKILGIEIGKQMETFNWESRLPMIQSKLVRWEDRDLSFTGKVLVIKAEILSSLNFLATTLPVPYSFLASLRRAMFRFIWGSQQEKLKRDIMYRPLNKGGKDVPELGSKLNVLFLTPIVNAVLKENNTVLWAYFAKFWVGHRILRIMGKRLPLDTPHAEFRPRLYDKVLTLVRAAGLGRVSGGFVNRKVVEKGLAPKTSRLVPVRTFIESECIHVWRNINCHYLSNAHKDLAWKMVHNCLPTKAFFYRRGAAINAKCPRSVCGKDESVSHAIWSCYFSKKVWGSLRPWLTSLYRNPSEINVLYGALDSNTIDEWKRWWIAINCVKDAIWKSRNLLMYKRYSMPVHSVVNLSLTLVKDYIKVDKKYNYAELKELWNMDEFVVTQRLMDIF